MKRKQAVICFVLIMAFLWGIACCAAAENHNMLKNGSFESVANNGNPADWYPSAYRSQAGYSRMTVTSERAHSGRYSALIENASSNDARFTYTAEVKPESLYRLSGYVFVENMEDIGNGANFAVEGIYSFSDGVFDTNNEWQYLEWYGETGEHQTEVTIGIRVGGYSAESVGKAYFDDLVLEEVNELPQEVIASLWYDAKTEYSQNSSSAAVTSPKSTALFMILAAVFLFSVVIGVAAFENQKLNTASRWIFPVIVLFALILRIFLGMNVEGYSVDINCFKAWSLRMANVGPAEFYADDYFCDYPPGALLLLWPVGLLLRLAGAGNNGLTLLIVKALPILFDMLGAFSLHSYAKKHIGQWKAVTLSAFCLLNPAALVNGAAWGQVDSVLTFLILITALAALQQKWDTAVPLFVVSALVKPQALLFAPVGIAAFLYQVFTTAEPGERKASLKRFGVGSGFALVCALLIVFPFSVHKDQPVQWIVQLYQETLSSYSYATLNTANLYYLFGANWTALSQQVPATLCLLAAFCFALLSFGILWEKTNCSISLSRRKKLVLSTLTSFMAVLLAVLALTGVNYSLLGYGMMAFVYLFTIACMLFNNQPKALPYYMSLALIGVYVLGIKVHERYLFPALLLLLLAYVNTRDRRILAVFTGFSITTFINTAVILDNSILFGAAQGHLNSDTLVLNYLLCIMNLLLCFYAMWLGIKGLRESKSPFWGKAFRHAKGDSTEFYRKLLLNPSDYRLHLRKRDYLTICAATFLYGILAFSHLGSMTAPQTAWVSTSNDENVVLELENSSTFSVLYYAGVSYQDFSIEVSEDGKNWSAPYPCEMREGLCYRWNYALNASTENGVTSYPSSSPANVLWLEGKYLKVNADNAGLNLWEMVARDQNGQNLPLKLIAHQNAQPHLLDEVHPAENLIDEQSTCTGEPGWFNGTYFDEIYHVRTAYEHLHGQAPYETTHPPLGKLLIAAGISIFGMTPFGWRFAGAYIGVLMLPALYLLAMQLTHKRSVAVVSMLALMFDLMHFTQTRIATIDSFPVFFILLTYLFMVRYMQMDHFVVSNPHQLRMMDKAYLKTLIPLFWCGIFMGLSIASKWIGIYSAAGLAILFAISIYRQGNAGIKAWHMEDRDSAARLESARKFSLYRIAITCGFCILFFVLIPCMIYALSYIPYLSPTGPVTIKRIIRAQQGMLDYHSTPGLGMDHPFQSPWWQWPFILKPMWFAQDQFEPAGYASTILCFGNPWVFYIGAIAMSAVLVEILVKPMLNSYHAAVSRNSAYEMCNTVLAIGFLAQYLPWVLVPRSMYMYHYFASVPFIILATSVLLERLTRNNHKVRLAAASVYMLGAIVFFVMFFPYASGYVTSIEWLDAMKWFSKLYY